MGTVVDLPSPPGFRYGVRFPDGVSHVREHDLEPVADDPFELLLKPPTPLYPYDGWLRREALRLLDAYRNDPAAALSNSRVEPQPHQVSVLLRALEAPRPRLILADQVGLGKTVEAGLILKELRSRNVLKRVLILVPANLVTQWLQELQSKFNEVYVLHDAAQLRYLERKYPSVNPWTHEPNIIASYQFARGEAERLAEVDWDLVIFDEAHHARRHWNNGDPESTKAYKLMEALRHRTGGMLLLTATPMQLHDFELFSLVELVAPGLFQNYPDFVSKRERIAAINRHMVWLRRRESAPADVAALRSLLRSCGAPPEVQGAALDTADGPELVASWLESQHLLAQVLVRNRRDLVGGFTKRVPHTIQVEPTAEEITLENDLIAYITRWYGRAAPQQRAALGLVLTTFLKLAASSSRALASALSNRAHRLGAVRAEQVQALTDDPDLAAELQDLIEAATLDKQGEAAELRELAERARRIRDTKLTALDEALIELFKADPGEKVLIFTQFLGTLEMLRERLSQRFSVQIFHGLLSREQKDAAQRAFKGGAQILISSEAGGEGRNFQFAHILFNYDLPWNPMRIEQRIGRLDRHGQTRNVLIYNFAVHGTLDERILHLLQERIHIFTESVGALEPILGDIETHLREIVLRDASAARHGVERYEVGLDELLRRAREREEQLRDLVMDSQSFRRDQAARLLGQEPLATTEELECFVRAVLARYPMETVVEESPGLLRIAVPQRLRQEMNDRHGLSLLEEYHGSFDWRVALADEQLHFFAFGHPLVEALVRLVTADNHPPLAVLESPAVDWIDCLLVDYEVRFRGVRSTQAVFSHTVTPGGIKETFPVQLAPSPDCEASVAPVSRSTLTELRDASWQAAEIEAERRSTVFEQDNRTAYEDESRRIRRRYAFEERFLTDSIDEYTKRIEHLTAWGGEAERKIIPALRGRVEQDQLRLGALRAEGDEALEKLEKLLDPTSEVRVLGVARLVPVGTLDCKEDDGGAGH